MINKAQQEKYYGKKVVVTAVNKFDPRKVGRALTLKTGQQQVNQKAYRTEGTSIDKRRTLMPPSQ